MKEKIIVNNFFVLVDKIETMIVEIYFGNARTCFKKPQTDTLVRSTNHRYY